jgi:drug/metabolite transporter (DMT)-like permease
VLLGIILTVPDLHEGLRQGGNLQGVLLALLNALVVALYFLLSSHILKGHSDMPRAAAWSITGTFIPLLIMAPFRTITVPADATTWFWLLALATISTVLPIVTLNAGIQKLGAVKAAILSTIEPVFSLILSFLLLGERLLPIQMLGSVLILISVVLLQLRQISAKPVDVLEGL